MRALQIAATGMDAQQTRVETISNNIANMSTTAFNARKVDFADLIYQNVRPAGSISSNTGTILPTGVQLGLGVRVVGVSMLPEQGALEQSNNELDIAVNGHGYFQVQLPSGETAYTRDGSFKRDAEGLIVTSDGFQVGGGITIPADGKSLEINGNGEVYIYFEGQVEPQLIGTIELATFVNQKGLEAVGQNLFKETAASGSPIVGMPGEENRGFLQQYYTEGSSVDVVAEMTDLIQAQRGYEMNSKTITAVDQMLSATVQIR